MSERIEHLLVELDGKSVEVVRPMYGTQSDSWRGFLTVYDTTEFPIKFHLQHGGGCIIFTSDDVKFVGAGPLGEHSVSGIIRLKGPQNYVAPLVHA